MVGSIHMEIDNRTKYRSNQEPSTVLLASYIEMNEKRHSSFSIKENSMHKFAQNQNRRTNSQCRQNSTWESVELRTNEKIGETISSLITVS